MDMDAKVAELQSELEHLQQQLQEKDNDIQRAVEVGQFLLEENSKLKDKVDSTVKECTEKIESLEQENYVIQQKLDAKTGSENWFNTELAHYKEGFQKENEKLKENLEIEKQQEISKLQRKIDDLQLELETSQRTEKDLQSQIQQLEDLVQQGLEQTEVISKSFLNDEIGELKTELVDLKNENTNLKSQLIEEKSQCQKINTEVDGLRNKVFAKESELEEIQCQAMSYFNSLENARTEILDLKTEMEALRMESSVHSKKGNSLFSELEDRRVDAEKKLVSLKVQFDAVKDKYEFEKQQNHKLKMQMVVLFQKSKGTADTERLRQLESHLSRERAENQELSLQIQKLKKSSEVSQAELINRPQTQGYTELNGKKFDENYVNYLRTIIKEKDQKVTELMDKMEVKKMHLLDKKNNLFHLERKLYDTEAEREKVKCENLKLKLEIEDLKVKLDPEKAKNEQKPIQYKTEKLPGFEKPNPVMSTSMIDTSVLSDTLQDSVFFPCKPVLKPIHENSEDMENKKSVRTNSKGKSVSISESVMVQDINGDCETESLSEKHKKVVQTSDQSKPKGRRMTNIKQVTAPDNVKNINDCKSQ